MIEKNSWEYLTAKAAVVCMNYRVSVFDVETGKHTIFLKECDAQEFDGIVNHCDLWEGRLGEVNFGQREVTFYIGRESRLDPFQHADRTCTNIGADTYPGGMVFVCSICETETSFDGIPDYCPMCGAKVVGNV